MFHISGNVLITQPFPPHCEEIHEEKLEGLEKARAAALEMAQEEDEAPKEGSEDEEGISLALTRLSFATWEYGVAWYPRGLQLQG